MAVASLLMYFKPSAEAERVGPSDDLRERFRRGDDVAFLEVYRQHEVRARGLVQRFFGRTFDQEEALQEVWLLVHRMRHAYIPERGAVTSWLLTLAANRCRQLLRDRGRRLPSAADVLPDPGDEALQIADEENADAATTARMREAVARFVAALDTDEARFFELAFVGQLSNPELSRALGISVRRCKYLRRKLLMRATNDDSLQGLLDEKEGTA